MTVDKEDRHLQQEDSDSDEDIAKLYTRTSKMSFGS
jgi:hypothetical protein